ncbi:hypothetical protein C8Q70DRAFT_633497 [Cubamyces menziesii]|uniref:Uncharacterized protein n=1 Tax=Trametes cubensis TaxID=1111947 RepID=A0AAD7TR62_9APHY|nr:hypothetical protein C8Q70DRAFT_633497 [Cubamyces menziesii]KAJ8474965.1 hypothetical protein ONZ51_g6860 [Trametes cubensis]
MLGSALVVLLGAIHVAFALNGETLGARQNPADDPNRTPSPPITRPNHEDKWNTGQVQTVTWDSTGLNVTGVNGTLLLGYVLPNTTRLVWTDQPLAQNVPLADDAVNIILPNVPTGDEYFMILLGDMNNTSPLFAIANAAIVEATTPPLSLPSQTMTTPSATITDTNVVSTIGANTSEGSKSTSTSTAPSGTNTPNSALQGDRDTLARVAIGVAAAMWMICN